MSVINQTLPRGPAVTKTFGFRLTEAQHRELMSAGGGVWLRAVLDERIAAKSAAKTGKTNRKGAA